MNVYPVAKSDTAKLIKAQKAYQKAQKAAKAAYELEKHASNMVYATEVAVLGLKHMASDLAFSDDYKFISTERVSEWHRKLRSENWNKVTL